MSYQVEVNSFHGPLDLLLFLVKRNEVDILDIPIATISAQFLHYLQIIHTIDVELAGDFLVMAATLMEIKSKWLLSQSEPSETVEEEDPRKDLVRQLVEYRKFKDAAKVLEERAEEQSTRLTRQEVPADNPVAEQTIVKKVELWDLVAAFGRLMRETEALQVKPIIVDDTPQHVYEEQIYQRVVTLGRPSFRELFSPPFTRNRLIGMFLALLELIRRERLWLEQPEPFGEIWIRIRSAQADAA